MTSVHPDLSRRFPVGLFPEGQNLEADGTYRTHDFATDAFSQNPINIPVLEQDDVGFISNKHNVSNAIRVDHRMLGRIQQIVHETPLGVNFYENAIFSRKLPVAESHYGNHDTRIRDDVFSLNFQFPAANTVPRLKAAVLRSVPDERTSGPTVLQGFPWGRFSRRRGLAMKPNFVPLTAVPAAQARKSVV